MTDRYLSFITVLAAGAAILWAVSNFVIHSDWIFYWIVAAFGIPFTVRGTLTHLFAGTPLLMAIAMIFGTATAVVAAAAYSLLAATTGLLAREGRARTVFLRIAYSVCEAFCYGSVYHLLKPMSSFAAIIAMACASYLVTSQFRLNNERWTDRFPLFLNPFLAASCAAFLSVFHNPLIPLAAVPVMAIIYHWTRLHEHRFRTEPIVRHSSDLTGN